MTAIAGMICANGDGVMMADSAASDDHCLVFEQREPKIITMGWATVGVSGAPRTRQILCFHGEPPDKGAAMANPTGALLDWVAKIRPLLREHGAVRVKEGVEDLDSRLLVLLRGHLFEIDSGWQVVEPAVPYWSIGCGQAEVRAAIHALLRGRAAKHAEQAERILRRAMAASAAFNAHVAAPYVVEVRPWQA